MGNLDALSREFAREHSDRLWKQLVVALGLRRSRERAARERTPSSPSVSRWRRPSPSRCRRSSALPLERGRRLLRPQPESLRAAAPDRLLRLETAARHPHAPLAGRGVRRGGCLRQRLSLRPGRLHRGAHGAAPADRALAGGGHRLRRRPLEPGRRPHGLHPLLGRAVHLLRADRPRRRRPHGVHGDDLPGHRDRHRALLRVVAAAVRRGRGRRWSPPGWWRPSRA